MSDGALLLSGLLAFLVCAGVNTALYLRQGPRLRVSDLDLRRRELLRYFWLLGAWEVAVLALVAIYWVGVPRSSALGLVPPLGAIAANALFLQLAVLAISRAGR